MEANSGLLSIREPKKLLINSFYKNVFFHKKVSSTRFFNKKVVYKKVLLFWPEPKKKIKKVLVLAPNIQEIKKLRKFVESFSTSRKF